MRTGGNQSGTDDFLLPAPTPPTPIHAKPVSTPAVMSSPVMSTMPMQPMPASVMSPDEMLRAYAERKKSMSAAKPITTSLISYPMPVANSGTAVPSNTGNMRVLYNAATANVTPTNTGSFATEEALRRKHREPLQRGRGRTSMRLGTSTLSDTTPMTR